MKSKITFASLSVFQGNSTTSSCTSTSSSSRTCSTSTSPNPRWFSWSPWEMWSTIKIKKKVQLFEKVGNKLRIEQFTNHGLVKANDKLNMQQIRICDYFDLRNFNLKWSSFSSLINSDEIKSYSNTYNKGMAIRVHCFLDYRIFN